MRGFTPYVIPVDAIDGGAPLFEQGEFAANLSST
jgi:hypothetical protein